MPPREYAICRLSRSEVSTMLRSSIYVLPSSRCVARLSLPMLATSSLLIPMLWLTISPLLTVAREETKSGWDIDELRTYLASGALDRMAHVRVRGVMTIASNTDDESIVRGDFERIRAIYDELKPRFGAAFDTLSIGMSDDYPVALEYGSTMVRIGTAIFGAREY